MSYPIPANEPGRLTALRALDILDTPPEPAYDEIAELAAQVCGCPVGYISFIDEERKWFKAKYGMPPDVTGFPREITVCATTICGTEIVTIPDLREDARFSAFPYVVGDPHLRFYCGMPLVTEEGYALGTLCLMDFEPRKLEFQQTEGYAGSRGRFCLNWSCGAVSSNIVKRSKSSIGQDPNSLRKRRTPISFF